MKRDIKNNRQINLLVRSIIMRSLRQESEEKNSQPAQPTNFFKSVISDPESKARKNLELVLTIFLGLIGLYFALTANKLAIKYGEQQDQINELKKITENLNKQNQTLKELTTQSIKQSSDISEQLVLNRTQSKDLSEQLVLNRKSHSNDSLQFAASFLQPNIRKARKLLFDIQMNKSSDFKITNNVLSFDVIPYLQELSNNIDELLDNPIYLMHTKERSKCVEKMPHAKSLLESLEFYSKVGNNYYGEKRQTEYYFKDTSTIIHLNKQFEELKQQQWDFVWIASTYFNKWYKMQPK